jgi:two-component system KDP operon response regulator KdpE
LEVRGYGVTSAVNGWEALDALSEETHDLVLLDLGLPGKSGVDVLREIRNSSDVPVIVVSARDSDIDKVDALDDGADDYVAKPFSIDELLARVRATLRRRDPIDDDIVITTKHFTLDFGAVRATAKGEDVHLTPLEWKILSALVQRSGRLVTQRQLLSDVWGATEESETGHLRVHMTHIRRKLEPEPARPRYFRTESGLGYRFEEAGVRTRP